MSGALITERSHSPTHKIAHFLTIEGVQSRTAQKETFCSKNFSCVDEKNESEFYIRVGFDAKLNKDRVGFDAEFNEDRKWLSVFLFSKTRDVFVKDFTITVLNVNLREIAKSVFHKRLIKKEKGHGLRRLFDVTDFPFLDDTICLRCELTFVGAPSSGVSNSFSDRDVNLDADLRKLFADTADADVSILVGERTFKAHKVFLKARSSYFRSLFESGMAESHSNEVAIEDANPGVFKHFLEYLYTGFPPKRLIEVAWELLPLSDRFGATSLKDKCEQAISTHVSPSNALKAVALAHTHCCSTLMEKSLPVVRENLKSLKETADWKELRKNAELMALVCESFAK